MAAANSQMDGGESKPSHVADEGKASYCSVLQNLGTSVHGFGRL